MSEYIYGKLNETGCLVSDVEIIDDSELILMETSDRAYGALAQADGTWLGGSNSFIQLKEAKEYLASTDFYFTVDKYATLSEERQLELTTARAEARELINSLEE